MGMPIAEEIMAGLGWPPGYVLSIGILELTLTLLYIYRPTSVLGAVLFMGLFGGAMATNLRADQPLFSHTLFSVYLGLIMWGGLGCAMRSFARCFRGGEQLLAPKGRAKPPFRTLFVQNGSANPPPSDALVAELVDALP